MRKLVDLIAGLRRASGSSSAWNLSTPTTCRRKQGFNKPGEYAAVLQRLAQRNVYAITSFILAWTTTLLGVAERTLKEIHTWPAGLPIFGLLTPLPATPLYKRLEAAGRLTRPKHWQEFIRLRWPTRR